MNRPRLIRGLRIAWTVAWGILCVLLIVLWVRSNGRADTLTYRFFSQQKYYLVSCRAKIGLAPLPLWTNKQFDPDGKEVWPTGLKSIHLSPIGTLWEPNGKVCAQAFTNVSRAGEHWGYVITAIAIVPYWMITAPAVVFGVFAAMPFLRSRFSLRTLLIATTAVAVILGLVVYATR
jgi:hypothetical protein